MIKRAELFKYVDGLISSIPTYVFGAIFITFLCGLVLLFYYKKKIARCVLAILLVEYLSLLFCSTLFFRNCSEARPFVFEVFWSYKRAFDGDDYLLYENIMNIVVFIPIGLGLFLLFPKAKWYNIVIIGFTISISIELLQLIFRKGLCEIDDVIHNSVGCIIGIILYLIARKVFCG